MKRIDRNIRRLYAYKFLSEFYLIVPVLIPWYVHHGLNATQVFTIQAAYSLGVLLLEIPSGYLADVFGRRFTLILGSLFLPLGLCIYAFSGRFLTFVLAELTLALGSSMRSGSDSALVYDTLRQIGREEEYKKYEGRTFLFTRFGSAAAAVCGGIGATLSLQAPFLVNIVMCLPMLPLALSLVEPERVERRSDRPLLDILRITIQAWQNPRLRRLMLMAALVMSTGIIGIWSYFLLYNSLAIPVGLFGLIFALVQLASAAGSALAHRLALRLGPRRSLWPPLLIPIGFGLLGIFHSRPALVLIPLNTLLWGYSYPVLLDEMNRLIDSEVRATMLSVAQMTGSLFYVVLAPLFGWLIDLASLPHAFLFLGIFMMISLLPLVALQQKRSLPPSG